MNYEAVRRWLLLLGGMAIMTYETVFEHADRPWIIAAALGMLGLPLARGLEAALSKSTPPPKDEEA